MTDRPILFSAPMVRALIAGTKTQTRRAISTKPTRRPNLFDGSWADDYVLDPGNEDWRQASLRIKVGDRLYVREHWRVSKRWDDTPPRDLPERKMSIVMEAGGSIANQGDPLRWIPSDWPHGERPDWIGRHRQAMHMPRWASRLTLTVTDVRVQRLQDISWEDAEAEGVPPYIPPVDHPPIEKYRHIWETINGPGSWEANPWVAAYTFTVEQRNIDARAAAQAVKS